MIAKAIEKAFRVKKERGWSNTYWAFDIHETIIKPNWEAAHLPTDFYPGAKDALQMITKRVDIISLLYTCSYPKEIARYLNFFSTHDIYFNYVNENPEVANTGFGCFDKKPYFNVLFEDKAGFDANEDWYQVMELLAAY